MPRKDHPKKVADPSLRLVGEVDGVVHSFPLEEGEQVIGSARGAAISLAAAKVSRRHAAIAVQGGRASIRDLGSKNGIYVNERPVLSCTLEIGDEIRFGPVRLRLESMDPGDGVLGLALESDEQRLSTASMTDETTLRSRHDGALGRRHFDLVDIFCEHLLTASAPDFTGSLSALTKVLGAPGAALVEWRPDPVLIGCVGDFIGERAQVPPLSWVREHAAQSATGDRHPAFLILLDDGGDQPVALTAAVADRLEEPLGLLIAGPFSAREAVAPLLRTLLRLIVHGRDPDLGISSLGEIGQAPPANLPAELDFPPGILAGESEAMLELYRQMRPLLKGDLPVLIRGETGVGKEHLAATLHRSSARRSKPMVAINCAAIPEQLLEAELFGIGKGVATGVQARRGKFLEATGGTLFLDEIGDLSVELQAKLLRALQEQEIHPLGLAPVAIDVRVVAATNADLLQRIEVGEFRADLYYRLAGFVLEVPPLRARRKDLPQLIGHFFRRFCAEAGVSARGITVKALEELTTYGWPGNVRELEHEVRRLAYLCPGGQAVDSEMLSASIRQAALRSPDLGEELSFDGDEMALEPRLERLERRMLEEALKRAAGNQSKAARLLEVSRNGLAYRLDRLGIEASDFVP